jgi:hypothetical protein
MDYSNVKQAKADLSSYPKFKMLNDSMIFAYNNNKYIFEIQTTGKTSF